MIIFELPVVFAVDPSVVKGVVFVARRLVDVVGCLVVELHVLKETYQCAVVATLGMLWNVARPGEFKVFAGST